MSQNPIGDDMKILSQNRVRLPLIYGYNEFEISICFLHALCFSMNIFYSEIGITPFESSKLKLWNFNSELYYLPGLYWYLSVRPDFKDLNSII